jgi:SAM-dependent methyltransferase
MYAIIADPSKKGRKWKAYDFFETGRGEVSVLMYHLERQGIGVERGKALDFGCGIGRLSQPLAAFFDRVVGVDVSETMIRLANSLNRFPDRVAFACNQREDLRLFRDDEFDFIYSNIVLQHLRPELSLKYLEEFHRILRPGGLLIFQLPSHRRQADSLPKAEERRDEALYVSSLRLENVPSSPQRPSTEILLNVFVRNASTSDWKRTEAAPFRLGNHWLSADGTVLLIQDDGRADLPPVFAAGAECLVDLIIKTPHKDGDYRCEVDVVHEMISWFKDKGASTVQFALAVRSDAPEAFPGGRRQAGPPPVDERITAAWDELARGLCPDEEAAGDFPMHGIPRERVEEFFRARGDLIVLVENDERGGREWDGFRYFVKKGLG